VSQTKVGGKDGYLQVPEAAENCGKVRGGRRAQLDQPHRTQSFLADVVNVNQTSVSFTRFLQPRDPTLLS
jgi:hypothetical protein